MRVSLNEVLQDSASDPRNGVMMKMLAMVEYGERAGSGLQGIFATWESVYHCLPKLEVTTSSGIDRTTLTLNFEGNDPDIEAMKRLYGNIGGIYQETQDSTQETESSTQETQDSTQETESSTQETQDSTQETQGSTQETQDSTQENNRSKVLSILEKNPGITLSDVAKQLGISRDGVKKIADKLRAEGVLSRIGSTKAGKWVVNKDKDS